jgi:hypothetical protein
LGADLYRAEPLVGQPLHLVGAIIYLHNPRLIGQQTVARPCGILRSMKPDLYTKAVLTVIALLLAVIALRPVLIPRPVHAATGHTYKVDDTYTDVQRLLDINSAEGWEVVTAWALSNNSAHTYVIFKK